MNRDCRLEKSLHWRSSKMHRAWWVTFKRGHIKRREASESRGGQIHSRKISVGIQGRQQCDVVSRPMGQCQEGTNRNASRLA